MYHLMLLLPQVAQHINAQHNAVSFMPPKEYVQLPTK